MRTLRRCVPACVLGLTLALAGAAFAQNANQSGSDKKASCCMSGGCCGDSCEMTKHDGMKNHATASDKESCCCGDSCQMTKHDAMKNHATSSDKESCCCCGDSCQMMKKDGMKNHATSSDKHECCCGDSCEMKDGAAKTNGAAANSSADKHECCCCGDS